MRILSGFMDTRTNNEDFALTPYLSLIWVRVGNKKITGIAITWGWYSLHIAVASNLPKEFKNNFNQNKP